MILSEQIMHSKELEAMGYSMPHFDRGSVRAKTYREPEWVHFGAGNIFRAFLADVAQEMLNDGKTDTGVITAEGYDYEIIDSSYARYDNLTLLAILKNDRTVEKKLLASITESIRVDREQKEQWERLEDIFSALSLKMVSFTITEKGYSLTDASGAPLTGVAADFKAGPLHTTSYLGKIASLLYTRYQRGALPVAMVSMDNCSANGDKLAHGLQEFARQWRKNGLVPEEFVSYLSDPSNVSFPWTMIDKITPRPDQSVLRLFQQDGFEGIEPAVTSKNTFTAPFVNAEKTQYLVIEDAFPNGRPRIQGTGVYFTDRKHVSMAERMKVTACLNPIHTALAIFGCLLGFSLLSEEMEDPELKRLAYKLGYDEGLPVAAHPGILEPRSFLAEVLEERIPNPFLPDTPQRIATDTSQKLSVRFGETIREYEKRGLDMNSLTAIPLVLAGWLRYLLETDDEGRSFTASPDPMLPYLRKMIAGLANGLEKDAHPILKPLLSNPAIFGVDLYAVGLGERVEKLFTRMTDGPGSVRRVLQDI